jgi:MFS transporter, DHA2 family, multidrug resistance protein
MLARRAQVHQSSLVIHLSAGNGKLQRMLASATHTLIGRGSSAHKATRQAYGLVAASIDQQATMLAYIDNFWMLGVAVLPTIPYVFLMKKVRPGGPMEVR